MDRRWGLLLLAVVLLAAAATPSIIGRKVAGKAVPAAIPGPPTVGDCLLEPVSQTQFDRLANGQITDRPLTIGACTVEPEMIPPRRFAATIVALALAISGCSTGHDAIGGSGTFVFTSPGGRQEFDYPVGERGAVGELSGPQVGVDDKTVALSGFAGKVVVLNIWGAWCTACRAETDTLVVASNVLQPLGAQFLGLDVRDLAGAGAAYQTQKSIPYPSIEDPGMRTLLSIRGFPSGSIPSTIVLDQDHRVAHIWLGAVTDTELVPVVKQLIAQRQSPPTGQSPPTRQSPPTGQPPPTG